MIFQLFSIKFENTYWQLKAVQSILAKGREITDHKQAA